MKFNSLITIIFTSLLASCAQQSFKLDDPDQDRVVASLEGQCLANVNQILQIHPKRKALSLEKFVMQKVYMQGFLAGHDGLNAPFLFGQRLLNLLDGLKPFLAKNENVDPALIFNPEDKIKVRQFMELFIREMELPQPERYKKSLLPEYHDVMSDLALYLRDHDLSDAAQLNFEDARRLTEKSFFKAIATGKIQELNIPISAEIKEAMKKTTAEAPREWENGFQDQGFRLLSKPKVVTVYRFQLNPKDVRALGYRVVVSAKMRSPERVSGHITQSFHMDSNFKIIFREKDQPEFQAE